MPSDSPKPVALITGAAVRVGRAIALRFADAGFDIAFTYLNSDKPANELSEQIRGRGRNALSIRADLTDPITAVKTIHSEFIAQFSRLDVLVNNASLYELDAPADASQLRRLWSIHVESPLFLSRAFSSLLQSASGCIVNMVDLQAERPIPDYLAYCSSKAGLWNLTLGLARKLAPRVRVNGIAPGVVEWPKDFPADQQAAYLRRVPLARAGTPQDVAEAVHFLCTGGSYLTGQILRLDGGRSIT
jgi:pteridine reductase